jgi:hypothetical protein
MAAGAGTKRRRGRPRDPSCGADPEELRRHSLVYAEPDDERVAAVLPLVRAAALPRGVLRIQTAAELERAIVESSRTPCWLIAHELAGRSTEPLVKELRRRRPKVPIYVMTLGEPDVTVHDWCLPLRATCFPGVPEADDVAAILTQAERFECASLSNLGYVVRRGRGALKRHEATYAASYLDGEPEAKLGAGYSRSSRYSIRSRTLRRLRASALEELIQDRLSAWSDFGTADPPPWLAR